MSTDESGKYEDYITDYDTAQRRSGRLAAEAIAAARQSDKYAAQGRALEQIKELAHASFNLFPETTDEQFAQLWRTAFKLEEHGQQGGLR